jgi:hypothetical protein
MLTVPTVLLLLMVFPPKLARIVLPSWAFLALLINVVVFAVPYTEYPLSRNHNDLKRMFSANDMLISFAGYSGRTSLGAMGPIGAPTIMLDDKLRAAPNLETFYADLNRDVVDTFARHGRVVVFGGVLDPYDWNAPWSNLSSLGVTKQRMIDFFYSHYNVRSLGTLAEIPAWEISPRVE